MNNQNLHYLGKADIYLQGMDALQPLEITQNYIAYYIGCPVSNIIVYDFRKAPALAAERALKGVGEEKFADVFNHPGWIEIRETAKVTEIYISELDEKEEIRTTLWLGILYNQSMVEHNVIWKLIRPITDSITAFAVILPRSPFNLFRINKLFSRFILAKNL